MEVRLDRFVEAIEAGQAPDVYGVNIMAYPLGQLGDEFAARYDKLRTRAEEIFPYCYVYPREYLHITVGPPAMFTPECGLEKDSAAQAAFEAAWRDALRAHVAEHPDSWPTRFQLGYKTMRLDDTAGIFLVDDPSGGVAAIRRILKAVDEQVAAKHPGWPRLRIPGIVHSTFLRFRSTPNDTAAERQRKMEELRRVWGEEPVMVEAERLVMIREVKPYLHQERCDRELIVLEVPYGTV